MRIFHYSHDTYGLGHIRRTLAIAEQLASDFPLATQLVVSGTPQPSCFKLPNRLDFIKLPDIDKPSNKKVHAPSLLLSFDELKTFREKIILDAIRHFNPDVVLVDKSPAGVYGELLPSLDYLKHERPETKLILGLSDIEDSAMMHRQNERPGTNPFARIGDINDETRVCDLWEDQDLHGLMEDQYDLILHYGNRKVYDPVSEYRLSRKVERKMVSCGYIGRTSPIYPKEQIRHSLKMKTDRLVVVTAGGGDDGFGMLDFYLKTLSLSQDQGTLPFDSLVVPGPLLSTASRSQLQSYRSRGLPFTFLNSTNDLFSYLNAADLVISMGGYNSLCEILSLRKRMIVIPHIKPRFEQLIRAGRFAARGLLEMIHPEKLTSEILLRTIHESLNGREFVTTEEAGLEMNGASNASRAIKSLFRKKAPIDRISRRNHVELKTLPSHKISPEPLSAFS